MPGCVDQATNTELGTTNNEFCIALKEEAGALLPLACEICLSPTSGVAPNTCSDLCSAEDNSGTQHNNKCLPHSCDLTCNFCQGCTLDGTKYVFAEDNCDAMLGSTAADAGCAGCAVKCGPGLCGIKPLRAKSVPFEVNTVNIVASAAVAVLGAVALWLYIRWNRRRGARVPDRRAIVTCVCAMVVCATMAIGMGMTAFDIGFDFDLISGDAFRGFDFWAGMTEMWANKTYVLCIAIVAFSGIWPFVKQILTIQAVLDPYTTADQQTKKLRYLGLLGKTAFLDIAMVCLVIGLFNFRFIKSFVPVLGVYIGGTIDTVPGMGVVVMMVGLFLSRFLTSGLVHVWPANDDSEGGGGGGGGGDGGDNGDGGDGGGKIHNGDRKYSHGGKGKSGNGRKDKHHHAMRQVTPQDQDGSTESTGGVEVVEGVEGVEGVRLSFKAWPTIKVVVAWALCLLSAALVLIGMTLPAVVRTHELYYDVTGIRSMINEDTITYTLWDAVDSCRTVTAKMVGIRALIAYIVLICSMVLGPIHSLAPLVCLVIGTTNGGIRLEPQANGPSKLVARTAHFVQLLSEWASLESLCVAVLALFANIGEIVDGMAESLEYEDDTETGPGFVITLEIRTGLWLCLVGSFMALFAQQFVFTSPVFAGAFDKAK